MANGEKREVATDAPRQKTPLHRGDILVHRPTGMRCTAVHLSADGRIVGVRTPSGAPMTFTADVLERLA